jgi:hypothetical protein
MPDLAKDPGFSIRGAVDRLFEAIVDASADREPPGVIRRATPVADEAWPLGLPLTVALSHLHGLEAGSCQATPCRLGGLCHALYEILIVQDEIRSLPPQAAGTFPQIRELRQRAWTAELSKHLWPRGRGAPRSALLAAVYQHLIWTGGLSYREASSLVIGPREAASPQHRKDRVRASVRKMNKKPAANARALLPGRPR